jgi:hypothetical protein
LLKSVVPLTDGRFLVRAKENADNDFVLGVVYKSTPTHHLVKRAAPGAEFTVNGTSTEGATTLAGVRAAGIFF